MNTLAHVLDALGASVRYLGLASVALGVLAMIAPTLSGGTVLVIVGLIVLQLTPQPATAGATYRMRNV